jgi:sensor histidine kinase YesM
VNVLARQNNTDAVVNINMALGKILRERLNVKSTIFETIQSELDTIHQYCIIMQYRYTNHVTISSSIDPHLLSEKIPKNILLPIVENAFYHGLTDEEGNIMGSIEISIYEMEHRINIEISDDGIGINREKLDEMKKRNYQIPNTDRSHIGLTNIYDRLQLVYQDKFEFDIESQLEFGTTFSISFPFYDSIQDDIKIFL